MPILGALCQIIKINGFWTKMIITLLGAMILVSGSFALNATLNADTETETFEKILFGTQITIGGLMFLFSLANLGC